MSYYKSPKRTKRPTSVPNVTSKVRTGHSNQFITIGYLKEKKPFEIFVNIGKSDPCESAYLEALARSIAEEYIDQLANIECVPGWHEGNLIKSPADAIARALKEFINDTSTPS